MSAFREHLSICLPVYLFTDLSTYLCITFNWNEKERPPTLCPDSIYLRSSHFNHLTYLIWKYNLVTCSFKNALGHTLFLISNRNLRGISKHTFNVCNSISI